MLLSLIIALAILLSLPKLGQLVRSAFVHHSRANWFFDAYLGTVISAVFYLIILKANLWPVLMVLVWMVPWFFKSQYTGQRAEFFAVALLFLIIGLPLIIQGLLMAKNADFALQFYNVDTPFTLMLAQSFQAGSGYPPALLENEGVQMMYHYGYHAFLALLSDAVQQKVHVVHALMLMPWLFFLTIGLTFQFIKVLARQSVWLTAAGVLLLWFGYQQYAFNYFNPQTLKNLLLLPGRYHAVYPYGPSILGLGLLLLILWLMRLKTARAYVLAIGLVAILPLVKIPYAPLAGIGFGLTMLYVAIHEKKWVYLMYPAAALAAMLFFYFLFAHTQTESPQLTFWQPSPISKDFIFSVVLGAGVLLVIKYIVGDAFEWQNHLWVLFFLIPLPMLYLTVHIDSVNAWQVITEIPFLLWLFVSAITFQHIKYFSPKQRRLSLVAGVLFVALPFLNLCFYSAILIVNPARGHEYCNNQMLAATLRQIPIKGTLLATNDLRYPAENFKRDRNQFQFSALYGHQIKVSNLSYLVTPDFIEKGVAFQAALPKVAPTESDRDFLRKAGVTHFVLAQYDSSVASFPVSSYVVYKINMR